MSTKLLISVLLCLIPFTIADPAQLRFSDCAASTTNSSRKFNVETVYGQVLHDEATPYLELVVIGSSPEEIVGYYDGGTKLATLFTSTSLLTLDAFSTGVCLCQNLRPASPLPDTERSGDCQAQNGTYCPIATGPFALSQRVEWGENRALTTLHTRLRAVDPNSEELMCLEVVTTPLDPAEGDPYKPARPIFWATVGLAIGYWVVVGVARLVAAWNRGINQPGKGLWGRARSAGYIVASALSGERLAVSPSLMRYCTPSMRDIIFHTQWCSALAMVSVQWPQSMYPILHQTAWSTLVYNITLAQGEDSPRWNPLSTDPYNPPSNFADQMANTGSPLYIQPNAPNLLFTLPSNASSGMESFAYTAGLRPQDLFGCCLTLFLGIEAGFIVLSILFQAVDYLARFLAGLIGGSSNTRGLPSTRSQGLLSKDLIESTNGTNALDEDKSLNGARQLSRPPSRFALSGPGLGATAGPRRWWRPRTGLGSFHGSVLHGNLVRVLVLFHLPITIFSVYQMTMSRDVASMTSIALAALSFAVFSLIIPVFLVLRVRFTSTNKLYDETRTLLSLGPLYNHYRHGSQMFASLLFATNVAMGVTIGAGQKSGTAQAVVILVVEIISALVTSIWLPWGIGASMGLITFLFCVGRIVIAVLLLILSPAINIGRGPGGWVAYGVLLILALIYLALAVLLVFKLVEAAVRMIGGVGFEKSSKVVDSGLLGACGMLGLCGSPRRRRSKGKRESRQNKNRDSSKRNSAYSDYMPPAGFSNVAGGKGSIHSGPPPSVLKPEHIRPYKEESDDENGYIMGPFNRSTQSSAGYVPVGANTSPPKKPSGFSRVGGGKANINSPYAITAGSVHTFPSSAHIGEASTKPNSIADLDDDPVPFAAPISAMPHQSSGNLPPGAMAPFHVRTKSQTAIVENYPPGSMSRPGSRANHFQDAVSGAAPPSAYRRASVANSDQDDSDVELGQAKRKPWYRLGRRRPHSSDGSSVMQQPQDAPVEPSLDLSAPPAAPGKSFVVIRKGQSQPMNPRPRNMSVGSMSPTVTFQRNDLGSKAREEP